MEDQRVKTVMSVFGKYAGGGRIPIVRLTKIEDGENSKYEPGHPRHIPVGFTVDGKMFRPLTIGESFYVGMDNYHTGVVTEIFTKNKFRTKNSVYNLEIIK